MASSSSKPRRSYHVFLSFRGPDVRNHFLSHLYSALDQAGICTYKDDEKLRDGEEIPHALMNAIEDSQIAIIVFSESYASSSWCLDELTKIIECRKQKDLIVWPVFYKVEPYEVRTPRESYRKALDKHEVKFGKDSEKVKTWKEALFYASFLSGEHFTDGSEAALVQRIVHKISTQLGRTPLNATKYPVGLESPVKELKSILNLKSEDDVLMVGLYGQGGVGKTTLAQAIYNAIFTEFQGSCFLGHIKDKSNDLALLQKELLLELLPGDILLVTNDGKGSQLIEERLCNKKVLIILDDVNHRHQLDALARDCKWFGKGSRIIVTTRDQYLVTYWKDSHRTYKVKVLQSGEALELFKRHASLSDPQIKLRHNLIDKFLHYAKGLPLALQVLGCSLRDRGEKEWEETLKKLADRPNKEINDVLRVSWDPLEDNEKKIFLDIACFFKGKRTKYIIKVLSSCDFYMTTGLQCLIERSLISEEYGTLQMHDLIQSMGMDIVKEECRDYPEKRSRLWLHDDVLDVLSRNGGTEKIEAIVLMLPEQEKMHIGPHAFTNMRKLRLLILHNVDNSCQDPIHLPDGLRWFEWPHCASTPDFRDASKNLVGLDMRGSNIKEGLGQVKEFKKLKLVNLGGCQSLVCLPDLSCAPNLEELYLYWCINLEHVHDSVANHRKLWMLNLEECSKLQRFPDIPNENESLREVILMETSVKKLPASIGNLVSLERLNLDGCEKLAILPPSIYRLQKLKSLQLNGCSKLNKFPKEDEDLSETHTKMGFLKLKWLSLSGCYLPEVEFLENHCYFPCLQRLDLSRNNFTNLPTCERLNNLEGLDVSYCQQLQEIPKIPRKLRRLEANACKSLNRIASNIHEVETVELYSSQELVCNGFSVNDWFKLEKNRYSSTGSKYRNVRPGEEMPNGFVIVEDGTISFMASQDLYNQFRGLYLCVVFSVEDGKREVSFDIVPHVNAQRWNGLSGTLGSFDIDHVWFQLLFPNWLWGVLEGAVNFGQFEESYPRFSLNIKVTGATVKKLGYVMQCWQLEDALKVEIEKNQLMDPASLYEDNENPSYYGSHGWEGLMERLKNMHGGREKK